MPRFAAGMDAGQVAEDFEGEVYEERVRTHFLRGVRSGVNGTPTLFINSRRFAGNWTDPTAFTDALEAAGRQPTAA